MNFDNYIKTGCKIQIIDNKKHLSGLMKGWTSLKESCYNGEENFMILTGSINNITVIDLDVPKPKEEYINSIEWFEKNICKISDINTLTTKTISGGYHIYFKYTPELKTTTKLNGITLDILNDSKGVLEGKNYTIVNDCSIRSFTESELEYFKPYQEIITKTVQEEIQDHSEIKLRKILNGLKPSRFDNRDTWIRIGYFLTHYTFGETLFTEFSKRSIKYNESTHKQQWDSFKNSNSSTEITIATVMLWLKEDNKELFEIVNNEDKIIKELNDSIIKNNLNITSNEVINMKRNSIDLLCDYENKIVFYHSTESKCGNIHIQGIYDSKGFLLKCLNCNYSYPKTPVVIPEIEASVIYNVLNQICVNNEDIKNKDTFPVAERIIEEWGDSIFYDPNLKTWFQYNEFNGIYDKKTDANITKEIRQITKSLKDEKWLEWISKISYTKLLIEDIKTNCEKNVEYDKYKFLIGFENGVYDLENSCFRKGKKEEYITMKCYYKYDENFNTELSKLVLESTFLNEDECVFAINRFTLAIEGINREQTMTFNYGFSASNGKSFLMERIKKSLGDYGGIFPVNLLTNKMKAAGDANTVLLKFNKKRFMYCSEPEANCKINSNLLKQLTGDTITARALYSNEEVEIESSASIFINNNRLPEIDGEDEGIGRRVRMLEFLTKFVQDPKMKNEKLMKNYSDYDIRRIEIGLMHIFIKNYKILQANKFKYNEPIIFYNIRNSYTNENKNEIKDILDEHFQVGTEEDFVKKVDVNKILKNKKIKMSSADLERFIPSIYECEYKKQKKKDNIVHSRVFIYLKNKEQKIEE